MGIPPLSEKISEKCSRRSHSSTVYFYMMLYEYMLAKPKINTSKQWKRMENLRVLGDTHMIPRNRKRHIFDS